MWLAAVWLIGMTLPLSANRVPPQPVDPVIHDGVKYSAEGDGRTAFVVANKAATGEKLWSAEIFHIHVKPFLEEDVQWVFIRKLKLEGDELLVEDEKSRCYMLNLTTKHVQKTDCR